LGIKRNAGYNIKDNGGKVVVYNTDYKMLLIILPV
jgi:hypothetical protein